MLLTYFLQKFRKAAPYLVVLQLFSFVAFLVYQKYSESEMRDLEGYAWVLGKNNDYQWNELEYDLLYFEHQVFREKRGKEFVKSAKAIWEITSEYRTHFEAFRKRMKDRLIFTDLTVEQEEKVLLQLANDNKWNEEITTLLVEFQKEMKIVSRQMEQVIGVVYWKSVEEAGYYKKGVLDKLGLNQPFEHLWQVDLTIKVAENILLNYAREHIYLILDSRSGSSLKCDYHYPMILPHSKTVYEGDFFEAEIRLMQRADFIIQMVSVGGKGLKTTPDGVSTYKVEAKRVGTHTIEAKITTKDRTGEMRTYTNDFEYTVLPKCN